MASAIRASLTSLARRWSALRAARAEASAAREFWDAGAPGEPEDRYWGSQPLVRRAINRRVTGDPNRWPMEWFAQKYVPQALPLGLSVGCGTGLLERDVFIKGVCERVEGVDFSPEAIAEARRGAEEAGLARRLDYRVEDINAIRCRASATTSSSSTARSTTSATSRASWRRSAARCGREACSSWTSTWGLPAPSGATRNGASRAAPSTRCPRSSRTGASSRSRFRWTTPPNRSARAPSCRRRAGSSRSWRTGPTAATSSGSSSPAWTSRVCARIAPARSPG